MSIYEKEMFGIRPGCCPTTFQSQEIKILTFDMFKKTYILKISAEWAIFRL